MPAAELLEDRKVPAVLTVNFLVTGDEVLPDKAGELSLREALDVVNSGSTAGLTSAEQSHVSGTLGDNDTIVFDPSIFGKTIHLVPGANRTGGGAAAAELTITRSVNIIGPGSSLLTIDASNNGTDTGRALDISGSNLDVSISGITIIGGTADSSAPHPGQGGGIFDSSGELSLTDVVLKNDADTGSAGTARRPNGGSAQGGGLYFSGDRLTISNSKFTGDTVTGGAGAVATVSGGKRGKGGAAQGGAIFVSAHHVLLQNDAFTNNSAVGAAGKGQGGAIYDANRHHIQDLRSDTFIGNSASTSDNDVFPKHPTR